MPGLDPAGGSLDKQCATDTQGSLYTATITTVQRTGATTVVYTTSSNHAFRVSDRILASGTSVDGGSFNTPKSGSAYIVNELITATTATTITVTQSSTRGTNPIGPLSDSGTLRKSAPYTWKDPTTLRWWGCTQFGNVTNWNIVIQNDPSLLGTGYNSLNFANVKTDKFGTGSPYSDANLNYCHDTRLRIQSLGFNSWGEYTNSNCRPTTTNAAYGGNNLAPAAERMPFTFQIQTSLSIIEDISNYAHNSCGLTRCPVKSTWSNVKASIFTGISSGTEADALDPVYRDTTNGWLAQFVANDASAKALWNNDNHDYLIGIVYEESDTVPGGKAAGQASQTIGAGTVAGPNTGNPGTVNWSSGGLVINSLSGYSHIPFNAGAKILCSQYRISAQLCNNLRSGGSSCTNAGNQNQVYPDQIFHTKDALANWLQGTQEQVASVPCSRSGSTVTCTLGTANVGPSTAPPYYNAFDVVTITGCSDSSFNTVAGTGMLVTSINQGAGTITGTLAGAGSSATGCTVGSGPGYSTIASLVTAWGLSAGAYDTFGTDETRVTGESIGTGNGATLTFTGNLAGSPNTYTPGSLQIFVGGALTCGDRGDGFKAASVSTTNHLTCNTNTSGSNINGTIDTAAGAYSITFDSAPGNGVAITANYSKSGWGTGKGLKDEAGQNIGCMTDLFSLIGTCGAAMTTDLNNFHYYYTKSFHATAFSVLTTQFPGVMRIATDPIGGYSMPADKAGMSAITQHTNILCPPGLPTFDPQGVDAANSALRLSTFSANAVVDKPYLNFINFTHVSDGYYGGNATVGNKWSTDTTFTGVGQSCPDFVDGTHAGTYYSSYMSTMLSSTVSCGGNCTGTLPFIGVEYLQGDHLRLGSLWSPFWDLYDGIESQPNIFTNTRGYQSGGMPETFTATIAASGVPGVTESGNTVTVTTTSAHQMSVGMFATISGVPTSGYNGSFSILTTPTSTTFTYTNPTSGLGNDGGGTVTITKWPSTNPNKSTDTATGVRTGNLQWLNNVKRAHVQGSMGGSNH